MCRPAKRHLKRDGKKWVRSLSYLLIYAFVLTQCEFALANGDAPALVLGSAGAPPVMSVNSASMEQAEGERQIRDEEEKQKRETVEKSKLIQHEENPLTLPDEDDETLEENTEETKNEGLPDAAELELSGELKQDKSKDSNKEIKEKKSVSVTKANVSFASMAASSNVESSSIVTPPFFAPVREATSSEEKAVQKSRTEEVKKEAEKKRREEERSIIEEAKKILQKISSDYYRGQSDADISGYIPATKDRRVLKSIVEEAVSGKDKPTIISVNPSSIPTESVSSFTPIPGALVTVPVRDSSMQLSTASGESNADRSNLLLTGPQNYVSPLSQLASGIINIVTAFVAATNNASFMSGMDSVFASSIEMLKEQIASALLQIVDLQNALHQLAQDQQSVSHELNTEAALVNKFAKALSIGSEVSKTELERIISSLKPVYVDQEYIQQAQSMLVYVETQLIKLEEIQTRRAQIIESLRKATIDPKELKEQLKETSKMLINMEILRSMTGQTKSQLLDVFRDLQKSQERLRVAIAKIKEMHNGMEQQMAVQVTVAKDHIYYLYAASMEVRERTDELNALRAKIHEEAKNNQSAIIEYYDQLTKIDTSSLDSKTKEEIDALRGHAGRLIPVGEGKVEEESSALGDTSAWQDVLMRASNIELGLSAAVASQINRDQILDLSMDMQKVTSQAERLAALEFKQAGDAETRTRNMEAIARGLAKRLDLLIGYSKEIEGLLARQGIIVDIVN